ncbi:tyrosine-type recombinase/integrase [Sphingobium sp. JS3065]|uniref:tyrosine-type recombinase/integrase n=1 Tax=Sphingobium sp. JS3065 TaxID=2970925 RepID=UPI0022643B5B|nr:tyrosine-type recombinase/integrase [Sphingobium sp. JS3065]UZW55952.1 tyrosine-type recombinase/integrase [Sphingobium sp. JS3065]
MKRRWLPEWVSEYRDRHGKPRYRFRRKGFAVYTFKAAPGTEAFRQEYQACLDGVAAPSIEAGADRAQPGSFDDLISRYYRSPDFLNPSERTRVVYRGVIERWRQSKPGKGKRYGEAMVRDLEPRHVEKMMADMLPHRTAANMLRKRLKALMQFAIRQGMAKTNPVDPTRPFKVEGTGFHTWTENEIAAYEAKHQLGTMARLAFDLLLFTGQRGGDVRLLGPGHVRDKRITLTQEKTGVTVSLPVLPPLAASILATPSRAMVFIVNGHGRPFTRKGFGNKFRDWCDVAGLSECSAHGLRKAAARRFAEAGCSNQQIKSWTGHTTDSEVARYTAAADQRTLSDEAGEMLMANLRKRLAIESDNLLEKGA